MATFKTSIEFYKLLADGLEDGEDTITLSPGPLTLKVDGSDKKAMGLLVALEKEYPELNVGEALKLLDSARWWVIFWASLEKKGE